MLATTVIQPATTAMVFVCAMSIVHGLFATDGHIITIMGVGMATTTITIDMDTDTTIDTDVENSWESSRFLFLSSTVDKSSACLLSRRAFFAGNSKKLGK